MTNVTIKDAKVKRVVAKNDKYIMINVECDDPTPNGNTAKSWVNVVSFDKDVIAKIGENDIVCIMGHFNTNKYTKADGTTRYDLRVVADEIRRVV